MSTSKQLEREAEQTRAQIADTLEELRVRMTPGEVVDQLVDYARAGSGGMFFRNLKAQAIHNPVPVALIGAGLTWLMMGGRGPTAGQFGDAARSARRSMSETAANAAGAATRWGGAATEWGDTAAEKTAAASDQLAGKARATADEWTERTRSVAGAAGDQVRDAKARLGEAASSTAASLRDAATSTSSKLRDAASSAYESSAESVDRAASAMRNSASAMGDRAANKGLEIMEFFKEQPLALAGIGIALGAAIGAALPPTEAEDRLIGGAADDFKETAGSVATEQAEKATAVAEHVYDDAQKEADKQGLGSDSGSAGQWTGRSESTEKGAPNLVPSCEEATENKTSIPEDVRGGH